MVNNREQSAEVSRAVTTRHENASKYLAIETTSSFICNAILNFASAYALFHGRVLVPATGPKSLLLDSIGETFFVVSLSMLIPALIARHRRRAGTLPKAGGRDHPAGNLYVRAIVAGLIFTAVLVPLNALVLPRLFPDGVSFRNVLFFKTAYGAIVGAFASWLEIRRSLNEID